MFVGGIIKANRMNKKLISEKNPQGVEYPEAVTADGKLVNAIDVEKGSDAWEGVKFYFPGCEGDEKEEMEFISRKHKNGDEEKDGRRYVVCDYQRPGLVKQIPAVDIFKENPEPVPF